MDAYTDQERSQLALIQRFLAGGFSLSDHNTYQQASSPPRCSDSYGDTIKDLHQLPWLERFVSVISDDFYEDYMHWYRKNLIFPDNLFGKSEVSDQQRLKKVIAAVEWQVSCKSPSLCLLAVADSGSFALEIGPPIFNVIIVIQCLKRWDNYEKESEEEEIIYILPEIITDLASVSSSCPFHMQWRSVQTTFIGWTLSVSVSIESSVPLMTELDNWCLPCVLTTHEIVVDLGDGTQMIKTKDWLGIHVLLWSIDLCQ